MTNKHSTWNNYRDTTKQAVAGRLRNLGPDAGDECETTRRWAANAEAFLAASISEEGAFLWHSFCKLVDTQIVEDIRDNGAGVWTYWSENGYEKLREFAPLFAVQGARA